MKIKVYLILIIIWLPFNALASESKEPGMNQITPEGALLDAKQRGGTGDLSVCAQNN